jgi:hypothetical protein
MKKLRGTDGQCPCTQTYRIVRGILFNVHDVCLLKYHRDSVGIVVRPRAGRSENQVSIHGKGRNFCPHRCVQIGSGTYLASESSFYGGGAVSASS